MSLHLLTDALGEFADLRRQALNRHLEPLQGLLIPAAVLQAIDLLLSHGLQISTAMDDVGEQLDFRRSWFPEGWFFLLTVKGQDFGILLFVLRCVQLRTGILPT